MLVLLHADENHADVTLQQEISDTPVCSTRVTLNSCSALKSETEKHKKAVSRHHTKALQRYKRICVRIRIMQMEGVTE